MFTCIPYSVDLGHVAIWVCLVHLWDWHAVDLSASDDATRNWKLRAGAHEVGIDLACALTAFVYAPVVMLANAKSFLMGKICLPDNQRLSTAAITSRKDIGQVRVVLILRSPDVLALVELNFLTQDTVFRT